MTDDEQIAPLVRCACHFRDRARAAASPESQRFHRGWMRAHALEAARRIKELRANAAKRDPLRGPPYEQRESGNPFVSEPEREIVYVECLADTVG